MPKMKAERIGKIVRVAPAQAHAQARNDIHITNIIQPKASVDALASEQQLDMICREVNVLPPPENSSSDKAGRLNLPALDPNGFIKATAIPADDDLDANPKLRKFKAKRTDQVEYIVDVAFLENVIKVLIDNHNINITPQDIEAILSPFGECVGKSTIDTDTEPRC
jgi:hypothetical protein